MFKLSPDNLFRLGADTRLGEFDCGDADLNEFLRDDARGYLAELLAVTYLVKDGERVAAFFSLSNDKLTCDPATPDAKTEWNRMQRGIPNPKRRRSYPAVKLGRLGVATDFQRSGVGTQILDWLKMLFVTNNRTGCRFITVDAYSNPRTIAFYERNHFRCLSPGDADRDTRQMYFDLKPFHDIIAGGRSAPPAWR